MKVPCHPLLLLGGGGLAGQPPRARKAWFSSPQPQAPAPDGAARPGWPGRGPVPCRRRQRCGAARRLARPRAGACVRVSLASIHSDRGPFVRSFARRRGSSGWRANGARARAEPGSWRSLGAPAAGAAAAGGDAARLDVDPGACAAFVNYNLADSARSLRDRQTSTPTLTARSQRQKPRSGLRMVARMTWGWHPRLTTVAASRLEDGGTDDLGLAPQAKGGRRFAA